MATINAKMCVLGEQNAGKSSIAVRWGEFCCQFRSCWLTKQKLVRGSFSENQESTIGAAFLTKTVGDVKLQVFFPLLFFFSFFLILPLFADLGHGGARTLSKSHSNVLSKRFVRSGCV